jgi:hypothetical protein
MDDEIRILFDRTARTRYDFLMAELQTCFTAVDLGRFELSVGNIVVVEREVVAVERGIRVIHRFLPEASGEQRTEVEARLAELQSQLDSLKAELP